MDEEYKVFSPRPSWEREDAIPVNPVEETESENDMIVAEDVGSHRDEFDIFSPRSPFNEKQSRGKIDTDPTAQQCSETQYKRIDLECANEDLVGERFVDDNRQAVSLWLDIGWLSWW